MGLDVYFYKTKSLKTVEDVERVISQEGWKSVWNQLNNDNGELIEYGYGRKIWDALEGCDVERCWDIFDRAGIERIKNKCKEHIKDGGNYADTYRDLVELLDNLGDDEMVFVYYWY